MSDEVYLTLMNKWQCVYKYCPRSDSVPVLQKINYTCDFVFVHLPT